MAYDLPVEDGAYSVRLHLVATTSSPRLIDIRWNDNLAHEDLDVFASAGGTTNTATTVSFDVDVAGGTGLLLEMIGKQSGLNSGIGITAMEVWQNNGNGQANPTVDVVLSRDGGTTFTETIASSLAMDRFGRGEQTWTVSGPVADEAVVKVVSSGTLLGDYNSSGVVDAADYTVWRDTLNSHTDLRADGDGDHRVDQDDYDVWRANFGSNSGANLLVTDTSNQPFQIANAGTSYYISTPDDVDFTDNEYTTAAGNNAHSGKAPDSPMSSLRALLAAYDLDPGDTVFVDSGQYDLLGNIVLTAEDAGVTIQGPLGTGNEAVLDRGNTGSGRYVFELVNADDVTLRNLTIIGGQFGVYADSGSDSDGVTIANSEIRDNGLDGVSFQSDGDNLTIVGNLIHDNSTGISASGNGLTIQGNTISGHNNTGISAFAGGATVVASIVSDNIIFGNSRGMTISGSSQAVPTQVRGNEVYGNSQTGIVAGGFVQVTDNTVYDNVGSATGISLAGNALAAENRVHSNHFGIKLINSATAEGNRIYGNTTGVHLAQTSRAIRNAIYSNTVGVQGNHLFTGQLANNMIYANTNQGILLSGGNNQEIVNNTLYQPVGDAIRLQAFAVNASLQNNIIWVESGYAISADSTSQYGLQSDYNMIYTTGDGKLADWGGTDVLTQVDWFYELGFDGNSLTADPLFTDPDGADDILGNEDDDFHLQAGSPAIDAGDPLSYYLQEPGPNGGRVNLGGYGNTKEATVSPTQLVQVLAPNGLEKFQVGQEVTIQWRSSGLTDRHPTALINVGSQETHDNWLGQQHLVAGTSLLNPTPVDLGLVTDPAPSDVYQSYNYVSTSGIGGRVAYELPLVDGAYRVRLHLIQTTTAARLFDFRWNGNLAHEDYDVLAAAGGATYTATTVTMDVEITNGDGLLLEMIGKLSSLNSGVGITAIEVSQVNGHGQANPTVDLLISRDGGTTFAETIASGLTMDRFGRGESSWTINGPVTDQAVVQVVTNGALPGDYNGNGVVDAADYTVWRDSLNSTAVLGADGDGDHRVDQDDYEVLKANFGSDTDPLVTDNSNQLFQIANPVPVTTSIYRTTSISRTTNTLRLPAAMPRAARPQTRPCPAFARC